MKFFPACSEDLVIDGQHILGKKKGRKVKYDAVVCAGPHHLQIASPAIRSLQIFSEPRKIFVITSRGNFDHFGRLSDKGAPLEMVDEDFLIEGVTLDSLREYFVRRRQDPARAGWYFQQFLKMSMCLVPDVAEHYLIWDGDTIMLRPLSFFDPAGKTLVNPTSRYNQPYFDLIERLLGFHRLVDFSFISEHLMIKKVYMQELIGEIQKKDSMVHWTKVILDKVGDDHLSRMGFSEFETYGNYVHLNHLDSYRIRRLNSLRSGSKRVGNLPRSRDLNCLSRKYAYASFEVWTKPSRWKHILWVLESGIFQALHPLAGLFSKRAAAKLKNFSDISQYSP